MPKHRSDCSLCTLVEALRDEPPSPRWVLLGYWLAEHSYEDDLCDEHSEALATLNRETFTAVAKGRPLAIVRAIREEKS